MNRAQVAFGVLVVIVGVGIGHLMYTHPEGLNPAWPMGMALIAPALFVLGGLHIIAAGLERPRLSAALLQAILLCFFVLVNWAAFFTSHFQCGVTISFLGSGLFGWNPSEIECRYSLRLLVAGLDAIVAVGIGAAIWYRNRDPRNPLPPWGGS
jgi:hypothetical protein